jgi:hypothetical protein
MDTVHTTRIDLPHAVIAELLDGKLEHYPPAHILAGVSAVDAVRTVPGLPYTIAGLVAHMNFWQQRLVAGLTDSELPLPEGFRLGVQDYPVAAAAEWDQLRDEYLASFAELKRLAEDWEQIASKTFEKRNATLALINHPLHNSYHLGQVVLLRRLLSIWPPPYVQT